jgi:hypothetical protein
MLALESPAGTQDVCRIFRLPGTINIPNAAKLKRGRVPCSTGLIEQSSEAYPIEAFQPFVKAAAEKGGAKANGHDRAASAARNRRDGGKQSAGNDAPPPIDFGNLPVVDVDALPVPARIRNMIRTGEDTEDAVPFVEKRSERAFAVGIAMAAAGCDDATMAAVMLDKTLPIGAHVRDQCNHLQYLRCQQRSEIG